jgi:alkanesulfonate monooxygenase SsuD/methylene tetrahydromethanopterin reductase-like flavin-dependent oxidoreductase (luciferase family)
MKFDVFFSICQTPVNGYMPSERVMWQNFFSQVQLADSLEMETAWIAETHLSCQTQKQNPGAVIPHFEGEIGLNTDVLQLAHIIFSRTKNLNIGSAIRNIQCNGGPVAHAEAVRTFLSLHGLDSQEKRKLELGFAAGRFPFSNLPYGVKPRNDLERAAWPVVKGKVFQEATEIFLRFLKGEVLGSKDVTPKKLERPHFRTDQDWDRVQKAAGFLADSYVLDPLWQFDPVGIVPRETSLDLLRLTIGCHDLETQIFANSFLPCGVFNLSITPAAQIEATHQAMQKHFHPLGGAWHRGLMPRTVLVFLDSNASKARERAEGAIAAYWKAMEGTLDPKKVEQAVGNALVGNAAEIRSEMEKRFHKDDRLMLWFDFHNHDNDSVKRSMKEFMEQVAPHFA